MDEKGNPQWMKTRQKLAKLASAAFPVVTM